MTRIDRFENQWIKCYIFAAVFIFATVDAYAQGNGNMIIKVHEVLRGRRMGFIVLAELVARAKANRKAGIERVVPFIASAALYEQLVLDFYTEEA